MFATVLVTLLGVVGAANLRAPRAERGLYQVDQTKYPPCQDNFSGPQCSNAPFCVLVGLSSPDSNCCPTPDGTFLQCCQNIQFPASPSYTGPVNLPPNGVNCPNQPKPAGGATSPTGTPTAPSSAPTAPSGGTAADQGNGNVDVSKYPPCVENFTGPQCSNAPFCVLVGLTSSDSNCCPTPDGTYLDCCQNIQWPASPDYKGPVNLPPNGENCPNQPTRPNGAVAGNTVDYSKYPACQNNFSGPQCSNAPFCRLVGLTSSDSNCCPTPDGTYLDCCRNIQFPAGPAWTGPVQLPPNGVSC